MDNPTDSEIRRTLRMGMCKALDVPYSKYGHLKAGEIYERVVENIEQNELEISMEEKKNSDN
ncbi:MAG: hypothetical protein OXI43_20120 [Candidatus Poribacteria bacterium]|nr:hypothetical protein [Candidatus Poribacteria bacterium]